MTSYGDKFIVNKLEVKQQLNVKTVTDAADSTPPTEGAQIGDVWLTVNNTDETNDGVWLYLQTAGVNGWVQCAQMNDLGGGGAA